MTSLALAIQFLTVIPIPGRLVWTHPATVDFGRALAFFPVVGLLIGAGGLALDTIFRPVLGVSTSSALVTLYFVVITGALHLDGFLDTCDGVFLSRKERRLDAMRDSRLGSYAVAGGLAVYSLRLLAVVSTVPDVRMGVFLFVPVLGRFTMALVLRGYPYAREVGAGNAFKTGARWWHIVVAGTIATSVAVPFGTMVVATGVLGGVLAWFLGRWITSRLGGLTGDTYGFICEVVETFAFVALSATPLV